jgi:hypothetical protein
MNTSLVFNKLAIFVAFELTSTKIINIFGLLANEVFANLRNCLLMSLFYQIDPCFIDF